jgi:hypothetical protein
MSSKKCKKDEILNPETNRCVKRSGKKGKEIIASLKNKSQKTCKKDEILNPETNRCVKRSGKKGKELLGKSKKRSRRVSRKKSKNIEDKILNPSTGRYVNINSALGLKILKELEQALIEKPKIYYPPNKVMYKNKLATITCRYYGRTDVLNTYGIRFDDNGNEEDFIHYDDLEFVSYK